MNTRKAIVKADELRPNAISEDLKASWIYELDGKVAEFQGINAPESRWPEDSTHLMPAPYDNIYELYLCAQIDNANMETALYENDMAMFNAAWDEARAWWRRTHRQPESSGWMVM